jgi:hypothetical protein
MVVKKDSLVDSLAPPTLNSTSICQFGTLSGMRDHSHPV